MDGTRWMTGAALVGALGVGGLAAAQPIRIDGRFDDWSSVPPGLTDPSGDATGAIDLTSARAHAAGTVVYVEFDSGSTINIASGPSSDQELFIRFFLPDSGTNVYVQQHDPNRVYVNTSSNRRSWAAAGFAIAPTYASDRFEMKIDLSSVGAQAGDAVQVSFGPNGTGGPSSDDTTGFIALTLGGAPSELYTGSVTRDPCAALRLASLNVLTSGLTDGVAGIGALVDAVDADVYCFQEEYGSNASQVVAAMSAIDPLGDGSAWNVHMVNDCVVAARRPLIPLVSYNSAYGAAIVDGGSPETSVAVLSIHPKCCGYIGSSEDVQRINETAGMVTTIEDLRSAPTGSALEAYREIPVVVMGDWNLVGSRTPLDMLTSPAIPGMARVALPKPGSDDHATWRSFNASSNFAPGQLDLVVCSADRLNVLNAIALNSETLSNEQLSELGLSPDDSHASDHLMLVVDLAARSVADLADPVGTLDFSDALAFLTAFAAGGAEADLAEPVGTLDFSDVLAFLSAFSSVCP